MDDRPVSAILYASSQRFRTNIDDRETWHSFSFGRHYDPANVGFGPMRALNDERLGPTAGYPDHGHADVEIVTWVVEGALEHTDASGTTVLGPGAVLAQSAGDGIRHSEMAAGCRTRFVQTWLRPDSPGGPPSRARVRAPESHSGLVTVVGGSALPVRASGARLRVGSIATGRALPLPDAERHHVFVASGELRLPSESRLVAREGDVVRMTEHNDAPVAAVDTRVMVWSF